MGSPPKPWERGATAAPATTIAPTASVPVLPTAPTVPERPATLTAPTTATTPYSSPYSRLGASYGGYGGGYGGIGSSYGGIGGMGGYGGYGGMTGMGGYGGMGYGGMAGYGGMGYGGIGMGGGMMGPNGILLDANGQPLPPSLTQTLESTTQHTFALLHSIVQTFSGVAQMLESTFMATHSSFFAMVGVIDQFGHLRNALGSVLGLFGLLRWMKETMTGHRSSSTMGHEFRQFIDGKPVQGPSPTPPRASKKPIIIFLLAIFGVPYAMTKLIKILSERAAQNHVQQLIPGQPLPPLDPSSLTFARALYPFNPTNPSELSLKENEIVAIMGKLDPRTGQEVDPRIDISGSEWWKGRTRDGREGWFPKKWVEILERKAKDTDVVPKKVDP